MPAINTYLNFNGNTKEAFDFYRSVFGGEFDTVMRYDDMPSDVKISDTDTPDKIMHISLPIGSGTVLMGSDNPDSFPPVNVGNNFHISISTDDKQEADRLFNGLSAGGSVNMPLADAFWGAYFGMCTDKFGVNWMMNCHTGDQNG